MVVGVGVEPRGFPMGSRLWGRGLLMCRTWGLGPEVARLGLAMGLPAQHPKAVVMSEGDGTRTMVARKS